jgi:exosortase J
MCHFIRGEKPQWRGQLAVSTAGTAINFSSAYYDDGVTQSVEASTMCSDGSCGEFTTERIRFGFVYSRPDAKALWQDGPQRPTRVLLRVEKLGSDQPADAAREGLIQDLRSFLASARLDQMTRPDGL